MKKEIIFKLVSAVLALTLLVSCNSAGAGPVSSAMTENENNSTIISSEASKEETSSDIASLDTSSKEDKQNIVSVKPEKNQTSSKDDSSKKPEKLETSSQKPTSSSVPTINENLLINKPNAYIPTEITKVDAIEGDEINFVSEDAKVYGGGNTIWKRHFAVVRSLDEFNELHQLEGYRIYDETKYPNVFSEEFYKNNVLIVLLEYRGAPFSNNVEKITKKDGALYMYIDNTFDGAAIAASSTVRTFITISKEDMKDVETVFTCVKW